MRLRDELYTETAGVTLLTVGYANRDWPEFADALRAAGVRTVLDVRTNAWSGHFACYRRGEIEVLMREAGFGYEFWGEVLGGKPKDETVRTDGRVDYGKVAETRAFREAVAGIAGRVLGGEEGLALLCGCGWPHACHRGGLLTPAFEGAGVRVGHVLMDGRIVGTLDEARAAQLGGQGSLF